ncbi:MAG: hypothetical protein [Microvirus sp.]|nr:MAG: hypothetical protein [Microvirus sp.]
MRHPVNKQKSASKFRNQVGRTKRPNIAPPPTRGGYRL